MSGRRSPKSRITLGYLSANFHNHPTAHTSLGLFRLHDRRNFDVFTFSYGPNDESIYRKKIERDSDRFFDIREIGYAEAARRINESGVDILIDLNGHTRNTRLELCALRPSPVQVTYKGFPGTSGPEFFDYILTDSIVTPESEARHYSEQLVFLPNTYWVNDHTQKISDANYKRIDFGLPESGFVFSSFNGSYKIEPVMFGVWMKLLKKVPNSVLWLLRSNDLAEKNLKREAEAVGVEADRLVFADKLPRDEHFARLRLADLALDTRIYGGHTRRPATPYGSAFPSSLCWAPTLPRGCRRACLRPLACRSSSPTIWRSMKALPCGYHKIPGSLRHCEPSSHKIGRPNRYSIRRVLSGIWKAHSIRFGTAS